MKGFFNHLLLCVNMTNKGFSTLFAVIIASSVSLTVVLSLVFIFLSSHRVFNSFYDSFSSKSLATACAEKGLMEVRKNTDYTGSGSMTFEEKNCYYTVMKTGVGTREINAFSKVNLSTSKIKVTASEITPKIIIDEWLEVADF